MICNHINKRGKLQNFKCLEYARKFTPNFGFEKIRVDPFTITGTFRDREINFRGLKKSYTTLIGGFKTYYNHTKKHIGLNGLTPAESSNIKVDKLNK